MLDEQPVQHQGEDKLVHVMVDTCKQSEGQESLPLLVLDACMYSERNSGGVEVKS